MPEEQFKPVGSKNYPEALNAAVSTAAHEMGHAYVGLTLAKEVYVKMQMADGHKEPDFAQKNKMCIHGCHKLPDNTEGNGWEEAMLGYGGNVGQLLYLEHFANMDSDDLYKAVHSSGIIWSDTDLKQIARAKTKEEKREAFDRAVALIRPHLDDLRKYTVWLAKDFMADPNEVVFYTIDSPNFKEPKKDAVSF